MQRDNSILQLMGIQAWELWHPERISRQHQPNIGLPADCRLLFVSPQLPTGELAKFYQKILSAMKLSLEQSRHILPEQLQYLDANNHLVWIWFAGDKDSAALLQQFQVGKDLTAKLKILHSPELAVVQNSAGEKRQLWNQIRSHG